MTRFAGSFCLALLVVAVLLAMGVQVQTALEPEDESLKFHDVELLTAIERARFADELGESRTRTAPKLPPLKDIPAVEIQREVQGFVQLEVIVDASGGVSDIRVLGAAPAGVYEQQAMDQVLKRRYAPAAAGHERILEIVQFRVPAPNTER
jgi:TonB family protein